MSCIDFSNILIDYGCNYTEQYGLEWCIWFYVYKHQDLRFKRNWYCNLKLKEKVKEIILKERRKTNLECRKTNLDCAFRNGGVLSGSVILFAAGLITTDDDYHDFDLFVPSENFEKILAQYEIRTSGSSLCGIFHVRDHKQNEKCWEVCKNHLHNDAEHGFYKVWREITLQKSIDTIYKRDRVDFISLSNLNNLKNNDKTLKKKRKRDEQEENHYNVMYWIDRNFDFDFLKWGYDGEDIFVQHPEALASFKSDYLFLDSNKKFEKNVLFVSSKNLQEVLMWFRCMKYWLRGASISNLTAMFDPSLQQMTFKTDIASKIENEFVAFVVQNHGNVNIHAILRQLNLYHMLKRLYMISLWIEKMYPGFKWIFETPNIYLEFVKDTIVSFKRIIL